GGDESPPATSAARFCPGPPELPPRQGTYTWAMMQPRSGLSLLGAVALYAATGLAMAGAPGQDGGRAQAQESRSYSLDPAWVTSFGGVRTFADPSKDSLMGFTFPTEVREVLVRVGDRVEAGDVLVRARDVEPL